MAALDQLLGLPRHVVAQVVEAELVVRAVGDVGLVLQAPLLRGLPGEDHAGRHAEGAEHAAHQLRLVRGEEVVDRDDVDAAGRDRVQVGGHRRDEGLALAGLHLRDVAEVESGAAHDLHVEGPQTDGARGRLTDGGERLGQEVVERLPRGVPLAQLDRLGLQLPRRRCAGSPPPGCSPGRRSAAACGAGGPRPSAGPSRARWPRGLSLRCGSRSRIVSVRIYRRPLARGREAEGRGAASSPSCRRFSANGRETPTQRVTGQACATSARRRSATSRWPSSAMTP